MQYALECECGKRLPVEPTAAGGSLTCVCGRRVVIPTRDEFGSRPLILSAASVDRRVHRLVDVGELPPPGPCACCHRADSDVVDATLICERYRTRHSGGTR